jgi:hypothetical protein
MRTVVRKAMCVRPAGAIGRDGRHRDAERLDLLGQAVAAPVRVVLGLGTSLWPVPLGSSWPHAGTAPGEAAESAARVIPSAALGGFSTWEPGAPYIVKVRTGTDPVPYEISSRTQLEPDTEYALCQDDQTQVCTVAKTDADGTSGP